MKLWQNLTDLFKLGDINTEMTKRYKDSILELKYGDKTHYVKYRSSDGEFFYFNDKDGNAVVLAPNTEAELSVPKLPRGLYNTWKGVCYVTTNPARQWKRGVCSANTNVIQLINVLPNQLEPYYTNEFNAVAHDLLEPQKDITLEEAQKIIETDLNVRINQHFALQQNHLTPDKIGYLFYNRCLIGYAEKNILYIKQRAFAQEVFDSQRSWCPNHIVKVI